MKPLGSPSRLLVAAAALLAPALVRPACRRYPDALKSTAAAVRVSPCRPTRAQLLVEADHPERPWEASHVPDALPVRRRCG